jgi:transcriptional regulator CtsR
MDNYADKISKKMNEELNGEKIRKLVEIVLESHLSKEDQSNLIKEIIARKVLVPTTEMKQSKGNV